MNLPVASSDLESLIPHRPPICWIDSLVECTETEAKATVSFSKNHFAVHDGKIAESALVECVAQTVAAGFGWLSRQTGTDGKPAGGVLAAVTRFTVEQAIPLETPLEISVKQLKRLGPMVMIGGRITSAGQLIAAGHISVYG